MEETKIIEPQDEDVDELEFQYMQKFGAYPIGSPDGGRMSDKYILSLKNALATGDPILELDENEDDEADEIKRAMGL